MNAVKSTLNSPDQNTRAVSDHDSSHMRKPDLHTTPHTERKSGECIDILCNAGFDKVKFHIANHGCKMQQLIFFHTETALFTDVRDIVKV